MELWKKRTDGLMLAVGAGTVPVLALEKIRGDLAKSDQNFIWVVDIMAALVLTGFRESGLLRFHMDRDLEVTPGWSY